MTGSGARGKAPPPTPSIRPRGLGETMRTTLLARDAVFALMLVASYVTAGGDIVESFDSASDKEMEALFGKLVPESDTSNKAIVSLLRSKRTITFNEEKIPAACVGLMVLSQRKRIGPLFYSDLFKLALYEHDGPRRAFGWFSPSMVLARRAQKEVGPFLIAKLSSEDRAVKRLAALLLGEIKDRRAVAPLKKLFLAKGDVAASEALYRVSLASKDNLLGLLTRLS